MSQNTAHGQPVYAILGGTGGIGLPLCARLAKAGGTLAIGGRDQGKLDNAKERFGAMTRAFDGTNVDEVDAFFRDVRKEYGRLDGAVNLIGSILLKPVHLTKEAEWDETIHINLKSAFATVRGAVRNMKSGGSIVLMSTAAARAGIPNHGAIAAAKAGIEGLMQSSAASYAPRNIRINAVAPGLVKTPLAGRLVENPASLKASEAMHALGRIGEPDQVASMVAWLLDPDNDWVTGQVFGIDGGLMNLRGRN